MLKRLSIKNYALIKHVDISFEKGYSVITGETGAGKSIILGALGLILGNRLDSSSFTEQKEKCVIEGHFSIQYEVVKPFFEKHDFDFEKDTILRREINLSGKSRMFLNDTPISLDQLKQFRTYVINIHSQHETLELSETKFQFEFIDSISINKSELENFRNKLGQLKLLISEQNDLLEKKSNYEKEKSFIDFQLNEIEELGLVVGEEKELLKEIAMLSNAEALTEKLNEATYIINQNESGIVEQLQGLCQILRKLENIDNSIDSISKKADSALEEVQEIERDLENYLDRVEMNPERLIFVENRLGKIHTLNLKHQVKEPDGLLKIQEELQNTHLTFVNNEDRIVELSHSIRQIEKELELISEKLHNARLKHKDSICLKVNEKLKGLGIPDARFDIEITKTEEFNQNGKSRLNFLFSANNGRSMQSVSKVASGGELSRLILALKAIMAEYITMPTMIFDEIDSGISGDIANKMANQLEQMSSNMQLITITHSPQLASKGQLHYQVIKNNKGGEIFTEIKRLNDEERVVEIAKMLSGASISDAAISNAKDLIKNN